MTQPEIELFLRAQRQQRLVRTITLAAICIAVVAVALLVSGVGGQYSLAGLGGALLGALLVNSDFGGAGIVSRGQLLGLIEAQISRDPDALTYIRASRGRAH